MSDHKNGKGRRDFLKSTVVTGAVGLLPVTARADAAARRQAKPEGIKRYARLGRTDLEVSDISFGSSRLRAGEEALVHQALDLGINYFDSAESYTGGSSETVLGKALAGRRDKVYLVSKIVTSSGTSRDTMMQALNESLVRLKTDYVDVYMTHAVNDLARLQSEEWLEFVNLARRQGKIRFSGMSGHAGHLVECVDYALDEDMVDVMLLAYNFGQDPAFYERITRSFDFVAKQPDLPRVLAKAKKLDVGIVAMKTLMGARLNDMRPWERGEATFAQAAFRWVLSDPNVDALIVSMTNRDDINEYVSASGAAALAQGDLDLLKRYAHLNGATYCKHACNDCEGACPYGVPIADVLRTRMYATDYQDVDFARREYAMLDGSASACLSCSGEPCRNACTHDINIAALCAPTHQMLS